MEATTVITLKKQAREIFFRALNASALQPQLERFVRVAGNTLYAGDQTVSLEPFKRALIIAIGKASAPMAEHCAELLRPHLPMDGLVIGKAPPLPEPELTYIPGPHPLPDDCSCTAAVCALTLAKRADAQTLVIWLISGGASAMMETPLDERISTADVSAFYRTLVHSGLSIAEMNTLRKHLSAVKGGRLAMAARRAGAQITLLVSDVPEGREEVIGSGPTLPDSSTTGDCRDLLGKLQQPLPPSIMKWFEGASLPETPKPDNPVFDRSAHVTLLSSATLCEHAANVARELGFEAVIDNSCDEWRYDKAAMALLYRLARLRQPGKRIALISAGELSVPITGPSGRGGRNQHFVLHMAQLLRQMQSTAVLSAGSDGIDGNSDAAGAVADTESWSRAGEPSSALEGFDSEDVFRSLGDAIVTGPTGNNLRDLRVLLAVD